MHYISNKWTVEVVLLQSPKHVSERLPDSSELCYTLEHD
jgi:hypothetical protein